MITALESEILEFLSKPVEERFESLALEIFHFQRRENPVYARYCDFLRTPKRVDSWNRIPALPQIAFKRSEIRSFSKHQIQTEFRTSGTTAGGHGKHFFPSLRLYEASVQQGWNYFRLPRHRWILLMQHPDDAPFSSLSWMGGFLTGFQRDRFMITRNGGFEIDRLMQELLEVEEAVTLFGTALGFLNLLEHIPSLRVNLPPGSIAMETGGSKGSGRDIDKHEFYELLSVRVGVGISSIWNEYGMTELSSQFYSHAVGRSHRAAPWMRFQVIDPIRNQESAPGEVGLLRVFDLANLWSVLAVQTQDLAVAQPDSGFLLLGRDPKALPRGCSRAMDEMLQSARSS